MCGPDGRNVLTHTALWAFFSHTLLECAPQVLISACCKSTQCSPPRRRLDTTDLGAADVMMATQGMPRHAWLEGLLSMPGYRSQQRVGASSPEFLRRLRLAEWRLEHGKAEARKLVVRRLESWRISSASWLAYVFVLWTWRPLDRGQVE